uniref:cytochrome c oxidase subunit II n=1 Tax=Stenochironomus zhengi TaxID=2916445 RepID=UPI001FAF993E|nr:cytochrome c oxidase subunit II [Stenochironomus zhengi]UKO33048.1 cytochrome c oxidase subunit II [Stenochironomus zhengi]
MSTWSNINLQDCNSPIMEQMTFFHDHALLILILITSSISFMFFSMFLNKFINKNLLHNQMVEMIWTILPIFILLFIAFPSLRILYMLEEINNPSISIKSLGHQWYWSYEYSDFPYIEFDSYMIPTIEMKNSYFRLLEVDNRLILPIKNQIRILISSSDVIHSWTIPSLGIKIDGSPGRLNQTNFFINRPGIFFGQCSEICGMNHSFMPIVIESTPSNNFIYWIKKKFSHS